MTRRMALFFIVAGAAAIAASFALPTDFAWNGRNSFDFCVATSRYASECGARLAWFGFAGAVLYPYVWAIATGIATAMEWRGASKIAHFFPAIATTLGCVLTTALGLLLILMRETWPSPAAQWTAVIASSAHAAILWVAVRRASPERRTGVAVFVGGIPFLALQVGLAIASGRYGNQVSGFVLAAAGTIVILAASSILFLRRTS